MLKEKIAKKADLKRIQQTSKALANRRLVQVEGATCSGKSTFVANTRSEFRKKGLNVMVIEEAASKILNENQNLMNQLEHPANYSCWRKAKKKLQQKVLNLQISSLENFTKSNYEFAVMDRGGASTAYHTVPFLPAGERDLGERICKELSRISSQVILLPELGFFEKTPFRYQKNPQEIKEEFVGIKFYLDRWKIKYITTREQLDLAKTSDLSKARSKKQE